jgi:hypothetical protein
MKPVGWVLYIACFTCLAAIFFNNECLEDDGYDVSLKHIAAYVCNGVLFFFGLVVVIVAAVTLESTSQIFMWLTMFALVLMVTAGATSIMILLDFDWGVRVMNVICLVRFGENEIGVQGGSLDPSGPLPMQTVRSRYCEPRLRKSLATYSYGEL